MVNGENQFSFKNLQYLATFLFCSLHQFSFPWKDYPFGCSQALFAKFHNSEVKVPRQRPKLAICPLFNMLIKDTLLWNIGEDFHLEETDTLLWQDSRFHFFSGLSSEFWKERV